MISVDTPPAPPVRRARALEVLRATQLTPHLKRITFGGEQLAGFPRQSNGAHIKLFLKRREQAELTLPSVGPNGPIWPPKALRPLVRTYTVRRYDEAAGELDIDFVTHGEHGPASAFAINAKPGDVVGISMPAAQEQRFFSADWCLLNGDLSALPAISAYLELLPSHTRGYAFIEIPDRADELPITTQSQVEVVWLHQNGVRSGQSTLLLDAVRQVEWPSSGAIFPWLAGESSAVVAVRNFVMERYGISREQMYTVPYWKAGQDEETYHEQRHRIMDGEE